MALEAFKGSWESPADDEGGSGGSREEVAMLVGCLRRTGRLEEALTAARDAAATEAKLAVRCGDEEVTIVPTRINDRVREALMSKTGLVG
jgi:hypothetical protein